MKVKLIFFSFFCSVFFAGNADAFMVEKYDEKVEGRFVVSPARLEYKLLPGDSIEAQVLVVNRLGQKAEFFVKSEAMASETGRIFAVGANDWIKPEIESFTLDQGERMNFNLAINIPKDTSPSGYYFSVIIGTEGGDLENKDQVKVISQIGVPLFVTVEGKGILKKGDILKFFSDKFFYRTGPVVFSSVFENQGNVHLQPGGEISVFNLFGAKINQIPIKQWIVFPGSTEEQTVVWNKKWLLGRYRADAKYYYGDNQAIERSLVFYAFPWHILLIIIALIAILYFLIKYLRSKYEIRLRLKKEKKEK